MVLYVVQYCLVFPHVGLNPHYLLGYSFILNFYYLFTVIKEYLAKLNSFIYRYNNKKIYTPSCPRVLLFPNLMCSCIRVLQCPCPMSVFVLRSLPNLHDTLKTI